MLHRLMPHSDNNNNRGGAYGRGGVYCFINSTKKMLNVVAYSVALREMGVRKE